ncbi:Fusaric acid resistance protein-like [Streptomyces sp. TLI_053]|uniref:FUSC family protein n=1 Tax=Streptomyces sp. TLI_053 TaxID=1855352 RepID=UPI00087D8CBA|nr:FUSC family protein [Streptomyces sp. TLI_053]SDS79058.1 Fusaric acid resistance protein-like [Streptomyces sp. TLI_053]
MRRSRGRAEQPRRVRPAPAVVHRAVRVTAAACAGFYLFRYGLDRPVAATYALFAAVALGVLARVEGAALTRARTILWTLPCAWALVCLGTVLAVHSWAAALGMVAVGFAVSYGSVGGPRMVGLANGLQLLYILPCFPPYAPDTLSQRLLGVTAGMLLLAAAERLLWPEPAPPDYRGRLSRAALALAELADLAADACAGRAAPPGAVTAAADRARAGLDDLRFSRVPVMERPAGAGAVDRALTHCAAALRYTGPQLLRILRLARPYPGAARLTAVTAQALRAAAAGLPRAGPVPDTGVVERELAAFDTARTAVPDSTDDAGHAGHVGGTDHAAGTGYADRTDRVRPALGTAALDSAEGARFVVRAVRVGRRAPLPPDETPADQRPGPFWYAYDPAPLLWWRRFRANLTPRSVAFRNALRTAGALGAARLLAGGLDLSHGFWVLLATLTLMRTSAADTRTTLRPALVGTALGAAATAAVLLVVGEHPLVYALALPPVMLIAFSAGPALGPAWGQGLFTLVVALVFTQLAPASWRLAEARVVNVATGAAIGLLAGLCAWPRGGAQDLRRRTAGLLEESADAVRETVAVLTGTGRPGGALRRARRSTLLTEAMYAQYRCERHDPAADGPNWQAAVLAGQHAVRGAEPLLARIPPGTAVPHRGGARALLRHADDVVAAFRRQAAALRAREPAGAAQPAVARARAALVAELDGTPGPGADGRVSLHAVDVAVWLAGLLDDLQQIHEPG